jgi:multiple sugar transport system permease protein
MQRTRIRWKGLEPYLYVLPALVTVLMWTGYPIVKGILISFQYYHIDDLNRHFNGMANYLSILRDRVFWIVLLNTVYWVSGSVSLQLLFGLLLALLLHNKLGMRNLYQAIILCIWAIPEFIVAITWRWLFNSQYGAINDILLRLHLIGKPVPFLAIKGLSLVSCIATNVWYGIPFFTIMILAALKSIPREVFESAMIDGAGLITRFFRITLPFIRPTILVTVLLRSIWSFNSASIIYVLTEGGPVNSSETLALYVVRRAFAFFDYGKAAAGGMLFIIILMAFTYLFMATTKFEKAGNF